ncbi:ankyrin repeat domain-containing protein [Candidatus Bathyarchaeota archaeon]|nr:ankyrin repeat domain-containing protein [Candidatus Bathyarchaeota archaeon]
MEVKDGRNNTPLLTAANLGRLEFMKLLIGGGADESARNRSGENVIHRVVSNVTDPSDYKAALELLDVDLRAHL